MVIVDLDWDAFLDGLSQCYKPGAFAAEAFLQRVIASGLMADWERGLIGPATFVNRLRDLLAECQREPGTLRRIPSMLELKELSSRILGAIRPGVLDSVAALRRRGFGTGILSNASPWHETDLRLKAPLDDVFDVILFSQDLGCAKPEPQIYSLAATCAQQWAANTRPGQTLRRFFFIDDTPPNVRAARDCGWNAALIDLLHDDVAWEHPEIERLSRRKSSLVFGDEASSRVSRLLDAMTR